MFSKPWIEMRVSANEGGLWRLVLQFSETCNMVYENLDEEELVMKVQRMLLEKKERTERPPRSDPDNIIHLQ